MTEDHALQGTAGARPPKATPASSAGSWSVQRLQLLVVGLNVCAIGIAWPALFGPPGWASALPPALLLYGVHNLGREPGAGLSWLGDAVRVAFFPASLTLAVALRSPGLNHESLGPVPLGLLVLSVLAYCAAAGAAGRSATELSADRIPLDDDAYHPPAREGRIRRLRTLLVGVMLAGAFAIGIIAPRAGGLAPLRKAWEQTAVEGALLTSVVASALAVALLTTFLGDALRRPLRRDAAGEDRSVRVATLLFLTLLGAVTYYVIQP